MMKPTYDKFIPLYEELRKFVKIFPTVINLEDIFKMAENLGIRIDDKELFYFGLYQHLWQFKLLISVGESNGRPVIIFNKMSEEYEEFLIKIEDFIWILTADIINNTGGIILKQELYTRDEIANALGKFEEYNQITLFFQLYIEGFEPSELLNEAFRLTYRYEKSLVTILNKKFGKLSETESKEYLEETRQMIAYRFKPVKPLVALSNLEIIAKDLKNILASL